MFKRLALAVVALLLGVAGTGLTAGQAWAVENVSTGGCVRMRVNYEWINANQAKVYWSKADHACTPFNGHFDVRDPLAHRNGPDSAPAPAFQVTYSPYLIVQKGTCFEGVAWRNDGGGRFFELGRTCTVVN